MMIAMRNIFSSVLLLALVLGSVWWYQATPLPCEMPLPYRIGAFDERFGLSTTSALAEIDAAVRIWEEATGHDLFVYDESADFTINFIFDERQAEADAQAQAEARLLAAEGTSDAIKAAYDAKVASYENLQSLYEQKSASYEQALAVYNQTVEQYNNEGGAPPEVFERLEEDRKKLDVQADQLNAEAAQLNALVQQINVLSETGNEIIGTLNESVDSFNDRFADEREFTQGDYRGTHINIYTFIDTTELRAVLAHELGHALYIDHVENDSAVMYYLMDDLQRDLTLTDEDLLAYNTLCADVHLSTLIQRKIQQTLWE